MNRRDTVPSAFMAREFPEAGGFMSYGSNCADSVPNAARYVDRILKGAKPGDLPVKQASKFELVLNLKTAREIWPHRLAVAADPRRPGDSVIARRRFLLAGGIVLLAARSPAWGQPGAKIRRVGFLSIQSSILGARLYDAFRSGMHDLGWREGQNVEYRAAYADGRVERLDALAKELIEQKVEVIVVGGAPIARAAQKATNTIPIVMANVSNAVDNKFVASLARPGGNITGVTNQYEEVLGKLIEIFHETVPRARRIAILVNDSSPSHRAYWSAAQSACAALKLVPLRIVASAPAQLAAAVAQIVREQAQAIVVVLDGMYLNERAKLEELIRPTRLPAAYAFREHAVAGGLLSYAADLSRNWRYAATFVDKILKGAKPADLPVEQPTKFDLVINLKTAKALGIAVPQSVLLRADEVIQ